MVDYVKPNSKNVAIKEAYKDLDLNFMAHPITGDVTTKSDSEAVKRAVKNIVLTNYYERPFKPSLGGNIRGLLFELNTDRQLNRARDRQLNRARDRLADTITALEPRVENVRCKFDTSGNSLNVIIFYNIKNGLTGQEVEFNITRAR